LCRTLRCSMPSTHSTSSNRDLRLVGTLPLDPHDSILTTTRSDPRRRRPVRACSVPPRGRRPSRVDDINESSFDEHRGCRGDERLSPYPSPAAATILFLVAARASVRVALEPISRDTAQLLLFSLRS